MDPAVVRLHFVARLRRVPPCVDGKREPEKNLEALRKKWQQSWKSAPTPGKIEYVAQGDCVRVDTLKSQHLYIARVFRVRGHCGLLMASWSQGIGGLWVRWYRTGCASRMGVVAPQLLELRVPITALFTRIVRHVPAGEGTSNGICNI